MKLIVDNMKFQYSQIKYKNINKNLRIEISERVYHRIIDLIMLYRYQLDDQLDEINH
jgi:hypothetical protein